MSELHFDLKSNITTMQVYDDHCVLAGKTGLFGALSGRASQGTKEIFYCDVAAVQYKKASTWTGAGFIKFEYAGSNSDSFSITTSGCDKKMCDDAYNYIKERVAFYKNSKGQGPAVSAADEIRKYKELLDMGAITREEFDKKKKELL